MFLLQRPNLLRVAIRVATSSHRLLSHSLSLVDSPSCHRTRAGPRPGRSMRLSSIIRLLLVVLCVTALLTLARSGQHLDRSQHGTPLPGLTRPAPISKSAAPQLLHEQDSDLSAATSSAAVPATTALAVGATSSAVQGAAQHTAAFAEELPVGENLEYKPPASLAGYAGWVDGTSFAATLRQGRPRGCARTFQVGSRADMTDIIRPMLMQSGACQVKGACSNAKSCNGMLSRAEIYWGRPWERVEQFFRPQMLQAGLIVNSIAGLTAQIGQKSSLARLHVRCLERFG